jgi:PIN domain nuclease of toxin-antitoxin system
MELLLDTHVWIWSQESPGHIGRQSRTALLDENNPVFVSTISTLELARLIALDELRISIDLQTWVERSLRLLSASTMEISHEIAIEAYRFPQPFHRDPADRLLVATARIHAFRLVTADDRILRYPGVETVDARL